MKIISISIISMLLFGCVSVSQKMEHDMSPKQCSMPDMICDSQRCDAHCGMEDCQDHCGMEKCAEHCMLDHCDM